MAVLAYTVLMCH